MKEIYLAGGCFWGVEHYFQSLNGIQNTSVGYANGLTPSTTYQDLKNTKHAETVYIQYDETIISLRELLLHFMRIIDPTSLNKQGNDVGIQYRSGIYYTNPNDYPIIKNIITEMQQHYNEKIVVEIEILNHYYLAEEYHQDYLLKHPHVCCHIPLGLNRFPIIDKQNYTNKSIDHLNELQFSITQKNETEPPYTNAYYNHFESGIYVDVVSGEPLFSSSDKFDSGCGWPAFHRPIAPEVINYREHLSYGIKRIEVHSRSAQSYLGRLFNDGYKGGFYCINSASLRFIPKSKMEEEGYGYLLSYV